ncbi:hypothetical protein ALC57_03766 [Trachymyrmex cornetzi]|uniref:Pre-rRNA-processing protein Ipi1 N-terminal domain-containing protein n=1 Tax=Trachymyrmex cornetzi TaxID=471704 RepID=A0A151JM58_9HYME|nr:hypothetical protein ALC57_03766 [Trachymyrmex cornetzi]
MYFQNFSTVRQTLSCAMIHMDPRMKEDSLLFLDVLVQNCSSALAKDSHKILPNFLGMYVVLLMPLRSDICLEVCPDEKVESYTKIAILSETAALLKNIVIIISLKKKLNHIYKGYHQLLTKFGTLSNFHVWFTRLFICNEQFPKSARSYCILYVINTNIIENWWDSLTLPQLTRLLRTLFLKAGPVWNIFIWNKIWDLVKFTYGFVTSSAPTI